MPEDTPDREALTGVLDSTKRWLDLLALAGTSKVFDARSLNLLVAAQENRARLCLALEKCGYGPDLLKDVVDLPAGVDGIVHDALFTLWKQVYCDVQEDDKPTSLDAKNDLRNDLEWAAKAITTHLAQTEAAQQEPTRPTSGSAVEALLDDEAQKILTISRSKESTDTKMRAICGIDCRYLAWKSPQWAELLEVSDAAIRKTPFWKNDLQKAINADR